MNQVVCLVVGPPNAEYAEPAHVDGHGRPVGRGGADRGGDPDSYAADTYDHDHDHDRQYVGDHGEFDYGGFGTRESGYDDVDVGHPDMDDCSWTDDGYGERPGRGEAGGGPPPSDRSSESVRAATNRSGGDRGRYGSRPGRGGAGAGAASSTGGSSVGAFPADGSVHAVEPVSTRHESGW